MEAQRGRKPFPGGNQSMTYCIHISTQLSWISSRSCLTDPDQTKNFTSCNNIHIISHYIMFNSTITDQIRVWWPRSDVQIQYWNSSAPLCWSQWIIVRRLRFRNTSLGGLASVDDAPSVAHRVTINALVRQTSNLRCLFDGREFYWTTRWRCGADRMKYGHQLIHCSVPLQPKPQTNYHMWMRE